MLYEKKNKTIITKKTRQLNNSLEKFIGLLKEKNKNFDYALIFNQRIETRIGSSIHTMFMKFPIDVLWLNKKKEIIDLKEEIKPWNLNITPKKKAKYVIELKKGTIKEKKLRKGIELNWENNF